MTKEWLREYVEKFRMIDKRNPIEDFRKDRFRKGWKRKSINPKTLQNRLTWDNLGFRLKQYKPDATDNEVEEILNLLIEIYNESPLINEGSISNKSRKQIKNTDVPLAYELSKAVFEGQMSRHQAVSLLYKEGMNESTVKHYLQNFGHMMKGEVFNMTLNAFSMEFFLDKIYQDYGIEKLSNALTALEKHIHYYEKVSNTIAKSNWEILNKFRDKISDYDLDSDLKEQFEILREIKLKKKTREELIKQLKEMKEKEVEEIQINHKAFKRENGIIALIKEIRGSKCQICGTFIIKKNGEAYVEAAHIEAKKDKGKEKLDNIILLCPNHHKEFDLGNRFIIKHDENEIEFTLNGSQPYKFYFE